MSIARHLLGMVAATFTIGVVVLYHSPISRGAAAAIDFIRPATSTDLASCKVQYVAGAMPAYIHNGLDRRTTTLCYRAFSVGYSGLTRTPLWSAEKLTAEAVVHARELARVDDFHADEHLSSRDRSTLDDYRRSGFDRGHMAPSGDMPTPEAQAESYTLANIVPQRRELNRYLWSDIEADVRRLARRYAAVYVVTGPVFAGAELDSLRGRVAVPTSTYKAVYIPGQGAAAYVATNTPQPHLAVLTIDQLAKATGIDPFPGVDRQTKAAAFALPQPDGSRRHRNRGSYRL